MSLKRISPRGIGSRLIIWSTLILSLSLVFVSTTVYYLLSDSLRKSDHELIVRLAQSYAHSYLQNGEEQLRKEVSPEVLVLITDQNGTPVFNLMPEYLDRDFEDEEEIEQIRAGTEKLPLKVGWTKILLLSGEENDDLLHQLEYKFRKFAWKHDWESILPLIDNDMAEVYTMPLDKTRWIKVGRSSEEREEHLSKIRNISLVVLIPFIFFGMVMSFILSRKILAPVKDLAKTIKRIKGGHTQARAQIRNSGDEVDELAEEFNALLEHNEVLVTNLKSTIDNVAHDLRTPMTRFRASAESALRDGTSESYLEALKDGLENSEEILKLLNAIMDVTEAESLTMKINQEKINLHEFISRLMDLYQYVAEEKLMTMTMDIPQGIYIQGDEVRLMQAFGNLLDNALKFSEKNKEIKLSAFTSNQCVEIIVEDQGAGIHENDFSRIWDRLYRGDKSRSMAGLGIGLSVVKAIIKAHHGSIQVESELNVGSKFIVTLPLCNG